MNFLEKIRQAKKLIKEAIEKYPKIAVACSFGKDSMTLVHLCQQVKKDIPIFTITTPFLFKEAVEYKDKMIKKYKIDIKEYGRKPGPVGLWKTDPNACCQYYKVEPTKEAVKDLDAWIAGLRKSEGSTRKECQHIEKRGNIIKINPILDFTELDIWRYLAVNRIPPNPLYRKGYRSTGCQPCTYKEKDERDPERAGRWTGTNKCGGECGIHTKKLK